MPRNFSTTLSPLGNIHLERNAKNGKRVGVTKLKTGKSRARITIEGKTRHLGTFDTSPEAAVAVATAKATGGAGLSPVRPYKTQAASALHDPSPRPLAPHCAR